MAAIPGWPEGGASGFRQTEGRKEEELSNLRAARQDLGTQLASALQGRREVESQLESLRVELESKQKLKLLTDSHQGAPAMRGLERQVEGYGKRTGPEDQLWTDEMKGKTEMLISGTTERSRWVLSSYLCQKWILYIQWWPKLLEH